MAEEEVAVSADSDFAFKILLSNKEAGSLIGKAGSAIVALQSKFGCKIRASHVDDLFPGTQERVILVTGPYSAVVDTVCNIIENMYLGFPDPSEAGHDNAKKNAAAHPDSKTITLVIPAAAGGVIIGRGGSNIKAVSSNTGAHIQLENKERQIHGLDERLIFVTGSLESAVLSAQSIMQKMSEEASATYQHMSTSYRQLTGFAPPGPASNGFQSMQSGLPGHIMPSHRPMPGNMMQFQPPRMQGRRLQHGPPPDPSHHGMLMPSARGAVAHYPPPGGASAAMAPAAMSSAASASTTTLTIQLADSIIPAIVGKGGTIIRSIQASTGARVRISAKGEFVAGTTDRIVTITGTGQQANAAYMMIAELAGFV